MPSQGHFLKEKALFPVAHALALNVAQKSCKEKLLELVCVWGQLGKGECMAQRGQSPACRVGGFWIPEVLWPGFCKLERKSGCWGCRQLVLAGVDCSVLLLAPGSSRGYIRGNEEEMGKCRALSRVCKISVI